VAKPTLELISDELISRLGNITVANGYEFTAVSPQLIGRNRNTWDPQPLKIYVEQPGIARNESVSYPGNPPRTAYDMTFDVYGYASQLDRDAPQVGIADPSVTDTQMIAAIQKAIANNDAATWHTFGGNAINAQIAGAETFDGTEYDGGKVTLEVTYRTSEIDPFA
jgi:hypothetical protein